MAFPKAPVVENENAEFHGVEHLDVLKPVGNVPGISMAEKDHRPLPLSRNEPPEELHAISGLESDGVVGQVDIVRIGNDIVVREVNELGLKNIEDCSHGEINAQNGKNDQNHCLAHDFFKRGLKRCVWLSECLSYPWLHHIWSLYEVPGVLESVTPWKSFGATNRHSPV
jgi:hypothetical protein